MGTIAVLIADDEVALRELLAELVGGHDLLEVVGTASDAEEAIELARRLQPDVALVDVTMPGGGGPHAAAGISDCSPRTRIVALTARDDRSTVLKMLRAGADSYILKGASGQEIVETILRSARGESVLSGEVAGGVIDALTVHLRREELEQGEQEELTARIRRVIEYGEFSIVFQPIFDLVDGHVVAAEALTRFSATPAQGPDRWFADAALVGLGAELELATARVAVAQLDSIAADISLCVNVSPDTLPLFGELVDVDGGERLVLEITEHEAIEDYEAFGLPLAVLTGRGVRVAIDDAGAGYASMRHALHLSPHFIKLDLDLTRGIESDRRRQALAAALIGFADEVGAKIIAEGIETRAELDALRALGVPEGQGYYLARPGPLPLPERPAETG